MWPACRLFSTVKEYERAVIFRLGRLLTGGARGPGVFFIIPCVDLYEKVDLRTNTYEIPTQEILTKDSVTVFVNAIMYYKVSQVLCSDDLMLTIHLRSQTRVMPSPMWMTTRAPPAFWPPAT